MAEEYISTWRRPSRRHEEYPGYVRYGMPGVVALIDISGSIGSKDLSVFMTEIKSMMEEYGVEYVAVIYWHERVERVEELTDVSDVEEEVEVLSSFPSGGTRLVPALRKALEFSGDDRVVVIFTDGQQTEDGDLEAAAVKAGQKGVPLEFVGIGSPRALRDVSVARLVSSDLIFLPSLGMPMTMRKEKMMDIRKWKV